MSPKVCFSKWDIGTYFENNIDKLATIKNISIPSRGK